MESKTNHRLKLGGGGVAQMKFIDLISRLVNNIPLSMVPNPPVKTISESVKFIFIFMTTRLTIHIDNKNERGYIE